MHKSSSPWLGRTGVGCGGPAARVVDLPGGQAGRGGDDGVAADLAARGSRSPEEAGRRPALECWRRSPLHARARGSDRKSVV